MKQLKIIAILAILMLAGTVAVPAPLFAAETADTEFKEDSETEDQEFFEDEAFFDEDLDGDGAGVTSVPDPL